MIQMKSIAAPSNAGFAVVAKATGRVSETPVPPAMARRFVVSFEVPSEEIRPVPYGPHKMTGVVQKSPESSSPVATSDCC